MGRILAVDDDALARAVLADALRALGHDATVVASATEALDRLAGGRYDLVLSDVMMPDMDGIELARRCADRQPPVPIALVSGAKRPDLRGVPNVGYLVKPLDADRLGRFLDTALGGRRASAPDADSWSGAEFLARVTGPVERFPPSRVLFLAHRVGATGAVRVTYGGVTGLVGLRGGKVVQVTGVPHLLAALGPGVSDARDLAVDVAAAVAKGHAPDKVFQAAAEGLGAWIARTIDATGGLVTFDPRWTPPPGAFPLPEPVPRFLARGLLKARPDGEVARAWAALGSATVRLRLPDDAPESTWGLDATATRLVRLAERTRTVERLLFLAAPRDEKDPNASARRVEVLRALDTLRALGLLVVDGGALDRPASEAAASPAAEPTQEDPRADRLAASLNAMERAHPVEILDLADRRRLTEEDVANAYRDISRRYHPDYHFNAPPAVRSLAEACFAKVNAAYDALRVPGGLAEAKRFLEARQRGEVFVSEKDHLAARVAFRRAEQLYRGRDYAAAAPLFEEAARLDARTWPHALYAAWCGWLAKRIGTNEAVAALDAIQPTDAPRAAEVLVHAGNILKQDGRTNDAVKRFQAALAKDPGNRDAQREIRLHEIRNPKPPAAAGLGGIFGRKKE